MHRLFCCIIVVIATVSAYAVPLAAQQNVDAAFSFAERTAAGRPQGWFGGPASTITVDSTVVRSTPYAARLQRGADSEGDFTTVTLQIPVDFAGSRLELRGWLRSEDVAGWAGLWLRVDGAAAPLAFDNMQNRAVRGTTEWQEYTITLPLPDGARRIMLGALLQGTGTVWVDDLVLEVDGRHFTRAPRAAQSGVLPVPAEFARGSGIGAQQLTPLQIDNIALLGRVWGFVKYHHPRVTAGEVHWDSELFRALPQVLEAADRASARAAIVRWLDRLGTPAACSPCAEPPRNAELMPDLDWTGDAALLGQALSERLQHIHRNRSASGEHQYVSLIPGVRNPDFGGEDDYVGLRSADAGYRLLALFRFWNIVEYWFPYRDIIGEPWDDVLAEYVPVMMAAETPDDYAGAMIRLSARVNDTHANVWRSLALRPPRGTALLPVSMRFIEDRLVVTGFTHEAHGPASGLQRGDAITHIDGRSIRDLVQEWRPWYSASNEPTRLRDIARAASRGSAGPARVTIDRAGEIHHLQPQRVPIPQLTPVSTHDLPGETFRMLASDVAYLKLSTISNADIPAYIERARAATVLVVDIRNYPSEFVVFTLGGRLTREPVPFARFTTADPANPGTFVMGPPLMIQPIAPRFEGRVVVLVDESTLSQAEYTAMALRAAGATIVGSTTAAADGNVSAIPLPGGIASMITGIGVFYPDGTPTQRIGIIPDLVVRPTIAGVRAGRDEVLEAAVSHALGRTFRIE